MRLTLDLLKRAKDLRRSQRIASRPGRCGEALEAYPEMKLFGLVTPQLRRSRTEIHAFGVAPKVARKRVTKAPGC